MRQVLFNVASNGRKHIQLTWFPHVSEFIRLVEQHENPTEAPGSAQARLLHHVEDVQETARTAVRSFVPQFDLLGNPPG